MNIQIEESWKEVLQAEFEKPYFHNLVNFVKSEYAAHKIYPPGSRIFSAFNFCSFHDVRVVIIGQDPYHGEGQANGLCFSVAPGLALPPSLRNIFKELATDINIPPSANGDLTHWAEQGVFLLNATLTVRAKSPGSHQKKGWEAVLPSFNIITLCFLPMAQTFRTNIGFGLYSRRITIFIPRWGIKSNESLAMKCLTS